METMKILVVEDNGTVSAAVADLLRGRGYVITTASSGLDALATLRQAAQVPDLVLLDIDLPVMNGWEFLSEKRLLAPPLNLVPVILFTGDPGVKLEGVIAADVVAVIRKPADLETILAEIGRAKPESLTP